MINSHVIRVREAVAGLREQHEFQRQQKESGHLPVGFEMARAQLRSDVATVVAVIEDAKKLLEEIDASR